MQYELELGDEITVNGLQFVLTEVGSKLNEPAYVVFKQPIEIVKTTNIFERTGVTSELGPPAINNPIPLVHLTRGTATRDLVPSCGVSPIMQQMTSDLWRVTCDICKSRTPPGLGRSIAPSGNALVYRYEGIREHETVHIGIGPNGNPICKATMPCTSSYYVGIANCKDCRDIARTGTKP